MYVDPIETIRKPDALKRAKLLVATDLADGTDTLGLESRIDA